MRLAALLALLPSIALAGIETPLPLAGATPPAHLLARAEQVIELVRSTREIAVETYPGTPWSSELRISLIVLDNGTGTDLSPSHDLYLSMWNTLPEYGIAWALEPVAAVYAFDGVTRTGPGLYEVRARILNPDGPAEDCYLVDAALEIDARALSVAVRRARDLPELDTRRYTAPMPVTPADLTCARP